MKLNLLSVTLLFLSLNFSLAVRAGDSLKDNMKNADKVVKQIKLTVNDPSHNTENATLAQSILPYFQATLAQTPEFIQEMPQDQQAAAIQEYQKMIQDVMAQVGDLRKAFEAGDNSRAFEILKRLGHMKDEGHDRFDP